LRGNGTEGDVDWQDDWGKGKGELVKKGNRKENETKSK